MKAITHDRMSARAMALAILILMPALTQGALAKKAKENEPATAPTTFAPLPEGHELASIWNDPVFARKLIGSYGFDSAVEPTMRPDEQAAYREEVVPLLREDPKKALPALQSLAKPDASAVFDFTIGNIYFQNENLTNAIKHFEHALVKFPSYRRAQQNLAFALVRAGRYEDAIEPLTRTVSLGGGDGRVFGLLGFAYLNQERYVSAEAAYRQALVFEPENIEFKLGLVRCSISTSNYDYALGLLDELIQAFPERSNLWTLQANVFIQKEEPSQATVSLEMLRRLGLATPQSLYLLGDLYMSQEARELALGTYLEAIEKDGGDNIAKALRPAEILINRGAWDEAKALIAKMRAVGGGLSGPDELKVLRLESKMAMAIGEGDKAIATLEQLLLQNPLDGEALLLAGDFYAKNGDTEKAEFRYESAARITGYEADANVKHAQMLVQSRHYTQAAELLRKAQKIRPRENVQRYLEKVQELALSKGN